MLRKQTFFLILVITSVLIGMCVGLWLHPDINPMRHGEKVHPKVPRSPLPLGMNPEEVWPW